MAFVVKGEPLHKGSQCVGGAGRGSIYSPSVVARIFLLNLISDSGSVFVNMVFSVRFIRILVLSVAIMCSLKI